MEAKTVLKICDRFRCLPSQVYAENASILRLLKIESLGTKPDEGGEVPEL